MQGIVKRFFNEKEVTSTLVMDALFSGCQQIEAPTLAAPSALRVPATIPPSFHTSTSFNLPAWVVLLAPVTLHSRRLGKCILVIQLHL